MGKKRMDNIKLKQITDPIHGTVFLSKLEAALISTAYFYRLHDIYQSSTVYLTYPANRTKRYEHSLGTMKISGRMLYSAITNAPNDVVHSFFADARKKFDNILEELIENSQNYNHPITFYQNCLNTFNIVFSNYDNESLDSLIADAFNYKEELSVFQDWALDQYQYTPMSVANDTQSDGLVEYFLYRCILQALRIVALFHDVGHPPFSHIIEDVLSKLYHSSKKTKNNWNPKKQKELQKVLRPYFSKSNNEAFACKTILTQKELVQAVPHERIGFSMLQIALLDIVSPIINEICKSPIHKVCKQLLTLYYIGIVEFTLAILAETDSFFQSIHKIVDGIIDADRLDYILRDSMNSGVDWGNIPYDRIINSVKLFCLESKPTKDTATESLYVLAYPEKVADDLIDVILMRYKVFSRINYHHGCVKNSIAMQTAVYLLAEDYLMDVSEKDTASINCDISILWRALTMKAGDKTLRTIQWNDSWLISTLHKSLVALRNFKPNNYTDKQRQLLSNLEELLLNEKKYCSVIKRGNDSKELMNTVLAKAGINNAFLTELCQEESKKLYENFPEEFTKQNIAFEPSANSRESLMKVDIIQKIRKEGNWDLLDIITHDPPKKMIQKSLKKMKQDGVISEYRIVHPFGREKTGLPDDYGNNLNAIYCYNPSNDVTYLDEQLSLMPQIRALQQSLPYFFIFVCPEEGYTEVEAIEKTRDAISEYIAGEIEKNSKNMIGKQL